MRTIVTLLFIAAVGGVAIYASQRPTIASGDVVADLLLASNKATLRSVACDSHIPIGVEGAHFTCKITDKRGASAHLQFTIDRKGSIIQTAAEPHKAVKHTSDPWGD